MATSRDQKELLWAWQGWRDAVGRMLRDIFEDYVRLSNEAAKLNGEAPHLASAARADCTWHGSQVEALEGRGRGSHGKAIVEPAAGNPEPCSWGQQRWFIDCIVPTWSTYDVWVLWRMGKCKDREGACLLEPYSPWASGSIHANTHLQLPLGLAADKENRRDLLQVRGQGRPLRHLSKA